MQSEPAIGGDWLEYSSVSGPELGLSLHERETHLRVDLGQRVAFLEQHQPSSEAGGEPLGTFRAPLTPELAARLRHELAASELDEVQGGGRGGPGTSLIGLKRRGASGTVEARFNNRNLAALRQLRPLLTVLDDVVDFVADKPFQAVRLALEAAPSAPHVFTVELRNVGTEVVFLPDLGQLARAKGDRRGWFGVRVAPFPPPTPGVTPPPLAWRPVELELPPAKSAWLRFSPGQEIAFRTRPVSSAEPGVRHLVQATFASYAGEAVIEGHIVIRGHALSNTLEWVPPPRAATGTPAASGR